MRDTIDIARESWIDVYGLGHDRAKFLEALKHFEALVRADESEACAKLLREALAEQPAQQPAVPDAIHHTDMSETLEYIQGWNDCRAEMLKGKK